MPRQGTVRSISSNFPELSTPFRWPRLKTLVFDKVGNGNAHEYWGKISEYYSPFEAYERACRKKDPLLSPHGFFYALHNKKTKHALEFLEKFGPLEETVYPWEGKQLTASRPGARATERLLHLMKELDQQGTHRLPPNIQGHDLDFLRFVDLEDFWKKQQTFSVACDLHRSLGDEKALNDAWRRLHESWSGIEFDWVAGLDIPEDRVQLWKGATFQGKRLLASILLVNAINHFLEDMSPTIHAREGKLEFELQESTLWHTIWKFFILDTSRGTWRICPECQRLFYPRRRDQACCNTRHQSLWSKRQYIRRIRAQRRRRKHGKS